MSKQAKVIIISVISVFLLAVFGLILVEQLGKNKITVSNHTDKRIESLDLFFAMYEQPLEAGLHRLRPKHRKRAGRSHVRRDPLRAGQDLRRHQ